MQVPRIDGALLRIIPETTRAEPALGLSLGQHLSARVLSAGAGMALIDVSGRQLQARTNVPLVAGQLIQLQVSGLGAEVALRLLGSTGRVSEQQFALATLATAHHAHPPMPPAADLGALLRMLEASATANSQAQARARISRLLGGLQAGADAGVIAAHLRDVLENSGLLFESRVRAWLASQAATAPATGALPPGVAADVKVLLGVLGRALGLSGGAGASPPPAPDTLRQHVQHWLATGTAADATSGAAALRGLRAAVLARQVEAAYHWVRDGTLAMDLPLVFDGTPVTARLRFRRGTADEGDGERRPTSHDPQGFFFDFAVEPPRLGPVRAQAHLAGPRLSVRFLVADVDVAEVVGGALPALRAALEHGGIASVRADVLVDAAQARLDALPAPALPPGGSVLDARA